MNIDEYREKHMLNYLKICSRLWRKWLLFTWWKNDTAQEKFNYKHNKSVTRSLKLKYRIHLKNGTQTDRNNGQPNFLIRNERTRKPTITQPKLNSLNRKEGTTRIQDLPEGTTGARRYYRCPKANESGFNVVNQHETPQNLINQSWALIKDPPGIEPGMPGWWTVALTNWAMELSQ